MKLCAFIAVYFFAASMALANNGAKGYYGPDEMECEESVLFAKEGDVLIRGRSHRNKGAAKSIPFAKEADVPAKKMELKKVFHSERKRTFQPKKGAGKSLMLSKKVGTDHGITGIDHGIIGIDISYNIQEQISKTSNDSYDGFYESLLKKLPGLSKQIINSLVADAALKSCKSIRNEVDEFDKKMEEKLKVFGIATTHQLKRQGKEAQEKAKNKAKATSYTTLTWWISWLHHCCLLLRSSSQFVCLDLSRYLFVISFQTRRLKFMTPNMRKH